jgi:predicted CXXCH cytochrome family protein
MTEEAPVETGTRGAEDNSYMDTATYAGSGQCEICHQEKYDSWKESLHNKKVMHAVAANVTGDFSIDPEITGLGTIDLYYNETGDVYHATVGATNYTIKWALGSGYWKQRYMVEIGISTYVLPIQYNTATQEWVGYHPENWNATTGNTTSYDNSWEKNCMGCHSTGYEITQEASGEWNGTYSELNIACESCHGPGSDHISASNAEKADYIWLDYSSDTCSLCHVRGKSKDGKHGYPNGMLPGDNIFDFYDMGAGLWGDGNTSKKHHQQWNDWNTTYENGHAEWAPSFAQRDSCMSCRSVEGFLDSLGQWTEGEREEEEFPDAGNATWQQTCISCHEPHAEAGQTEYEHQLRLDREDICMACHTYGETEYSDSPHHPQREVFTGNTAAGVLGELSGEPGMLNQTTCADCHMPKVAKSAVNYDISSHTFKPILPEDAITFNMPDSCTNECHTTMTQENAQEIIDNWQDRFDEEFEEVEHVYEEAHELREAAVENGTISEALNESYLRAAFNFHLLESEHETSKGVHNPDFLFDLIEDVEMHSEEVIEGLIMGTITGTVTDGTNPISGVFVVAGEGGDTTATDGTYSIEVGTTADGESYTVSAFVNGYGVYESTEAVEVAPGGSVTHDITLNMDTDGDGTADSEDTDDDNDGYVDTNDAFPTDPTEWIDTDNDTIGNNEDTDDDGDGVVDTDDKAPLDATVDTKISDLGEAEEADTTMFIVLILVLIVIIVVLLVMMMKKGGAPKPQPEPEPEPEPPAEEEIEEEE